MTTIRVDLRERGYDVHVGTGLLADLHRHVTSAGVTPRTVLVITQEPIARHHLDAARAGLEPLGARIEVATVPDGEHAKSLAVLGSLWETCATIPMTRADLVVALGGGVVGDLAGFVAATWNRGIAVLQVPTTVLAQTDAAIGGKTGINLATGKNLVGAFHQPCAVVCDVDTLATLGRRERIEGLGEVVKYGFIRDPEILDILEADPAAATDHDADLFTTLVERSVRVKAAVVAADEREAGERAHLNLGHTFGHAVETLTDYGVYHGEAVAIGTMVALRVSVEERGLDAGVVDRAERLFGALGLPVHAPTLERDAVWTVMARDKKASDVVRFALLDDIAQVVVTAPTRASVDAAIDATTR